jgi:CRP-like cAMP-binding protein
LLSVGQVLAAGVLASGGCGCAVRAAHFHWRTLLPHFRVDTSEAVMGGRECESAVATVRAAAVVAGAAVVAWLVPTSLELVLTAMLLVLAPLPGSAAWQWLGARHGEPRFTVRAGSLFEPRRAEAWVRWNAWLAGTRSEFGFFAIAWAFIWSILALIVCVVCQPGLVNELLDLVGPGQKFYPSLGVSLFAFAMALMFFIALMVAIVLRRRALQREAARLDRPGAAHRVALQGDTAAALKQIPLFQTLPAADLAALARAMQLVPIGAGEEVFGEDDPADAFYVALAGEFEILKRCVAPAIGHEVIGYLGAGDSFGEIALLEDTLRTATIRATQPSKVLRLASADFHRLVVDRIGTARIRELLQNAAFLGRLVFLADWPTAALVRFAQRCHHVSYEAGEKVMKKDRPNTKFFLIYDGTFEVRDGPLTLRHLRPGDYFGEISLLENGTATADVVAVEEGRCLVLERGDFLEFFAQDFHIGLHMEALAEQRLGAELFASR